MLNYLNFGQQSGLLKNQSFSLQQQKQLHTKILQLYAAIQAKSYQNLMMKKQNDQIRVQIKTLKQLAEETTQTTQNINQIHQTEKQNNFNNQFDQDHYNNRQQLRCLQDQIKYTAQSQDLKYQSLNEKMEYLIQQNERLQKQMSKFYAVMIENQKLDSKKQFKNSDGASTKISNNITSIQQIWSKNETKFKNKQLSQKHKRNGSHFISPRSIKIFD